jgi:hypothetical protein
MLYRAVGFACVALALALLASGSAVQAGKDKDAKDAKDKVEAKVTMHTGTLVSVTPREKDKPGELVMKGKTKEHTHKIPEAAKVTCDGKACKLSDLAAQLKDSPKTPVRVRVTETESKVVTLVEAFVKTSDSPKDKDKKDAK